MSRSPESRGLLHPPCSPCLCPLACKLMHHALFANPGCCTPVCLCPLGPAFVRCAGAFGSTHSWSATLAGAAGSWQLPWLPSVALVKKSCCLPGSPTQQQNVTALERILLRQDLSDISFLASSVTSPSHCGLSMNFKYVCSLALANNNYTL